ncbi:acetolactate synthase large subunit [Bacillus sp. FJAT-49736]|uniref:acetolactate synthase large subunit n=1 Tax=Bacillus sp. FJAT-49736 TaxID=2833582 RepID=UPI001BC926A1|nr:acetolactate synthase large subunit [Bacillus sp. FJAT-49736]MBS4175147.1 acetolactate synthase large subunit [Bacillus sp. FJAT-49736]
MKATDVLVQCLENEGVDFIFGIVGNETLDLADSLSRSEQIQYITVRHEQGAAFMADVYGRLSGKTGVCLATLGPGATNLLTGIASATLDHSPVVAITGQAELSRQHKHSHQYIEVIKLMEPITKWAIQVKEASTIPEIIRKAFRISKLEKPGAVAIELPEDLAISTIPPVKLPVTAEPISIPNNETILSAITIIQQSTKPFILVGNGVIRSHALLEFQTFIEALQAPVAHSFTAKGILPKEHSQNLFTFGFMEKDEVLPGIQEADLLIVIGLDSNERLPKAWNRKKTPILHIDSQPAEIDEFYPTQLELVGNIKETLKCFQAYDLPLKEWQPSGNLKMHIEQAYNITWNHTIHASLSPTIENILHVIQMAATDETIIISDVGAHKISVARTLQPKKPNRLIISNGLASIGISLPGAIGAKLACPNHPVICLTGDGGFITNAAELETAKRLGLSFIVIVLNDAVFKIEEDTMDKKFGDSYGVRFQNPDFVEFANSFGINGLRVRKLDEFFKALSTALQSADGITLIEVPLSS